MDVPRFWGDGGYVAVAGHAYVSVLVSCPADFCTRRRIDFASGAW